MTAISNQKVTLMNQRDGQERYTRFALNAVVEMISSTLITGLVGSALFHAKILPLNKND